MKLALTDIEQLTGPLAFLRGIFEQLTSSIGLVNDKEHNGDGTHADVTTEGLVIGGPLYLRNAYTITPPQIGSNQNNYAPQGWSTAVLVRISSDTTRSITGFEAPSNQTDTRMVLLFNKGDFTITLVHQSGSSLAKNRFQGIGTNDFGLIAQASVWLFWDTAITRWRVLSHEDA